MPTIKILRAGTFIDMHGRAISFSENDLATTAMMYNSAKHPAPIVLGHPQDDLPVYGWVESLTSNNGALLANVDKLSPDLVAAVRAGRYKKLSASFHHPNHPKNPAKGAFSLKHVGMLGASTPAVNGLGHVSFAEGVDGQSLLFGAAEFADAGLWAGLPSMHETAQQAPAEFACAPGFTTDPANLKIHQAALRYQHANGVEYLAAVAAVS